MIHSSTDNTTLNYKYYLKHQEYMASTGIEEYIKLCQRFYNGDQWDDDNDDNMIRTTINFISYSSNNKASKINGTPQYIVFTSNNGKDCTHLQRFDEYNLKKLQETTFNFQTLLDGENNGTAISYYRWDEDDTSYKGIYKGGLVQEQIDILRFAIANPYISNIQNQKWVEFWFKAEIDQVRDMIHRDNKEEEKALRKLIKPDNDNSTFGEDYQEEYISHGLVTVYVRFFRINGEVFHMSSTKYVDINEYPQAISPIVNKSIKQYARKLIDEWKEQQKNPDNKDEISYNAIADYGIDYEDMISQITSYEEFKDEAYKEVKEKFNLYPFGRLVLYHVNNSFYGRSDVKDKIPSQKAVNFNMSMMMKCIENNAYNKIFVKDGALQGQTITNEPSQILTDYTRMTNGWGIKFAESQPLPNGVAEFTSNFIEMVRTFGGFNQVMDGSITNQNISGYALQQQIKQANSTIEQQQQIFWAYLQDKAAIRLLFYKFFVDEATYTYELDDSEVEENELYRQQLKQKKEQTGSLNVGDIDVDTPVKKWQIAKLTGRELLGNDYDISIDVQQGMLNSELSEAQIWDTLIINGGIQNMTPEMLEMYLYANPVISQSTKDKLKHIANKQKREENYMLKQKCENYEQKLLQMSEIMMQLKQQLDYQTEYNKNITKEFTSKIDTANKVIERLTPKPTQQTQTKKKPQTPSTPALTEGEAKSNNSRGISGSNIA